MNYNHLHYFHVTAQEGSIARAAKRLNVSQPTISEQLKQLESYFGCRLFDRQAGSLRLNQNGHKAVEFTERIFTTGDRLRKAFEGAPLPAKVRVEIGMVSSAAHSVATDRLVGLFRDTKTLVRIRHGDNQYLLQELVSSGLDVLITDRPPDQAKDDGLKCRKIMAANLIFIAPKSLGKCFEGNLPNFLHHRPFINYSDQSNFRWEIDQYFRKHFIEPNFVAEVDDSYLILTAVAGDIGVGVIPESVLRDSGLASRVAIVGQIEKNPKLYAVYRAVEPTQETLRALDILEGTADESSDSYLRSV